MTSTQARPNKREVQAGHGLIQARVLPEHKTFFERAAALRGVNLTTFMVDSMREAALKTLKENEMLRLTVAERRVFVETLLTPPAPNQALRSATKRYNRLVAR